MSIDRSWMLRRVGVSGVGVSPEFRQGVTEFLDFAFSHPMFVDEDKIKCPCRSCGLLHYRTRDEVNWHLFSKGFAPNYNRWTQHGEPLEEPSRAERDDADARTFPYRDMVLDVAGPEFVLDHNINDNNGTEEPNINAKRFYDLLKDADEPLWEGSKKHTKLSAVTQLLHLKSENGWSDKGFDALLRLIKEMLPEDEKLPESYYCSKKMVGKLGLGYEKIDACLNDCVLYWKENEDKKNCPVCGLSRYKPNEGGNGKNEIPWKILRYFPLTPRLQRLYISIKTAADMRWHSDSRTEVPGEIRHPADGEAWKEFDRTHPTFASEVRNVRLGLATDGFNPFGHSSIPYSTWPVILVPYNLPPWMCMKQPFMFMSLLIPGPKSPGRDIDVYLRPLIEELKVLWERGVPAYAMLSGWSTHGKMSCPCCMDSNPGFTLKYGRKPCFFGCHRRFLPANHAYRKQRDKFDNTIEKREPPSRMYGDEVLDWVSQLEHVEFGKANGDQKIPGFGQSHNWKKQSIFFELPYWSTLLVRHHIDVMHTEKNVFDNVFNTVMNVKGKSKDHLRARKDMQELGIRRELHPQVINGKTILPKACYTLTKTQIEQVCLWVKELKLPDGYASNISRCVNVKECKFYGLKSHDCHVFMERLLPIAFRDFLPKLVWEALIELSPFFRDICSTVLREDDMKILESNIIETMCKLEKIFPPSFFDSMEHLPIHLAYEARVGGPVQYRWMYPFERCLHHLKKKVHNKARVKGSIVEAYIVEELVTFFSLYFEPDIATKFNQPGRNDDGGNLDSEGRLSLFTHSGRAIGAGTNRYLSDEEYNAAVLYVLMNCEEIAPFIAKYEEELKLFDPNISERRLEELRNTQFIEWFKTHVFGDEGVDERIRTLAYGPSRSVRCYKGFIVKGFKFHTVEVEVTKKTQNSGVLVKGSCYDDYERDFYGRLVDIIELDYLGSRNRVVLFKCEWFDVGTGVRIDRHGIVNVNFKSRLNSYEPFILAGQASQVFYAKSVSKKNHDWYTVIKTTARMIYDMPCNDDNGDDVPPTLAETYQEDDNPTVELYEIDDTVDTLDLRVVDDPGEEVDPEEEKEAETLVEGEEDEDDAEVEDEDEDEDEEEMGEDEEDEDIGFCDSDDMEVDD